MRRATFCVFFILTVSCSPKIAVSISESFPAIGWKEYSGVMDVKDSIPANALRIGSFVAESNNSNYRLMYLNISDKAREAGGNVVKLDSIYYAPFEGFSGKSRLYGDILHIDNTDPLAFIWEPFNTGDGLHLNTKPSPYKYELSIGSAGEPYYAMDVFPFGVMDIWYHGTGSLEMLNSECYDVLITPTASAEFAYHINANFAIIGSFGCSQARVTYYGQQCRMQIQYPALKSIHKHLAENAHPSCQSDGINIIFFQRFYYQSIIFGTVTMPF